MLEVKILLSKLKIKINHKYDYMQEFCADYKSEFNVADIVAVANEDDVLREKSLVPAAPIEACESLCIYREIAEKLPLFDRFVFHGAAIEHGGNAYLFTAPSGTGKTTHINLWRRNLGDNVRMINGDKPIIQVAENAVVYGTPWAGKEGYNRNVSAPIKAICILKQGKTNNIVKLGIGDALNSIMKQVYMPKNPESLSKTLSLIGKVLENVPVYLLQCDISDEAFEVAYNEMTR